MRILARIEDAAIATIIQFVTTFGVWLIAEHLALSGVVTIVVFGLTVARRTPFAESARVRIVSFATLLIQGVTLRPLLLWLQLPEDGQIEAELALARSSALQAAMRALDQSKDPAAERLKLEYGAKLAFASAGDDPHDSTDSRLHREVVPYARGAIADLRRSGRIGDEAYRQVEQELDWLELTTQA